MATLRNIGRCTIILPGADANTGLIPCGESLSGVPIEAMESDFIKGCVERGELFVVEDFSEAEYDAFRNPKQDDEPSMDDLRAEAEALGIEVSKRWSRDTLAARIAEARGE